MKRLLVLIILGMLIPCFPQSSDADSISVSTPEKYNSFGFNLSSVSGIGLSYRSHFTKKSQIQLTGGVISDGSQTDYSFGFEYQYEISNRRDMRYYISFGAGIYSSNIGSNFHGGIGVGFELPLISHMIFENLTGGFTIYYPAFYQDNDGSTLYPGGSVYFFYNF